MANSRIKNIKSIIVLAFVVLFSACQTNVSQQQGHTNFTDHQVISILLNKRPMRVEVVNTQASITQGLSDRTNIGSDGMLFFLPEQRIPTFWMKHMYFPLDLIWLNHTQIVDISYFVPAPSFSTPDSELPLYSPTMPANMVLEVPAGMSEKWHIKKGDALEIHP